MQVTEVANEGLKRAYTVVVPATSIAAQKDKRLAELAKDMKMPGFRPGKVPQKVVLARYGQAVMGEVLESSVQEATGTVVAEHNLRPALPDNDPRTVQEAGCTRINGLFRHGWLLAPALVDDALAGCGLLDAALTVADRQSTPGRLPTPSPSTSKPGPARCPPARRWPRWSSNWATRRLRSPRRSTVTSSPAAPAPPACWPRATRCCCSSPSSAVKRHARLAGTDHGEFHDSQHGPGHP